ncbi:hypothetical protein JXB12_04330 [candidate division KSB1 bacterium]|nr:hypothetical protein [candidate division KSB1 bacterium]
MRLAKLLFILILFQAQNLHSQTILAATEKYVIIDTQGMEILNIGDEYDVFKRSGSNEIIRIAKVKIIRFVKEKYAAQILAKSPNYEIERGDYIQIQELRAPAEAGIGSMSSSSSSSSNKGLLNMGSIIGGLAAGGMGYKYRIDGDDIYEKYEKADTREKAMHYYDETTEYDNKAAFGLGLGGTLFGLGVFHSLFGNAIAPPDNLSDPSNNKNDIFFSYGPIATGLFTLGLGYYFHDQANKAFDDYESASTPYDAKKLYEDSITLDRKSNATFGIGTAFVAFGLLNLMTHSSSPSTTYTDNLFIYPIQSPNFTGIGAHFNFNRPTRMKIY